ncbi:hypothetical protein ACFQZ8_03430 [Micromonospora azadirachtae]|uniref:Uncharacterized protein n=1 Tax=Micromonospora azadirachtae TaxID=1970735 RepID=A0ABW2ZWE6_9ACTN
MTAGVLALVGLLAPTGCTGLTEDIEATVPERATSSTPMRLDRPDSLLDGWHESVDRRLRTAAQKNMGTFKTLVEGEPTSAVGTAYVPVEEKYSRDLGMYRPGDQRVILLSGVSGTIADPDAALDTVFSGLPSATDVEPIQPGPLSGTAKCGISQDNAARVDGLRLGRRPHHRDGDLRRLPPD